MDNKSLHVLTAVVLSITLIVINFTTENPFVLGAVMCLCIFMLIFSKNQKKFTLGLIYFIPFALVTIFINVIFAGEGNTVLFTVLKKSFTLEALIYSAILSLKLLIVIYIFMLLGILIDSDRAITFFSAKMPKSTLITMISLKLFPSMSKRLKNLKEIYSIRGVDFQGQKRIDKVKSYIPVLSILLESSLESSFDIGEAAYVRGFLSGKRSIYDKQVLEWADYSLIATSAIALITFLFCEVGGFDGYDVYTSLAFATAVNKVTTAIVLLLIVILIELLYVIRSRK